MSEISPESLGVLFIIIAILIGGIVREVGKRWTFLPYTPTLFVLGLIAGMYYSYMGVLGKALQSIINMDPHGLLTIFLPPLIFESGFNADWHIFRKQSKQIFFLAFPSVIVSACIIMLGLKLVLGYDDEYYTWVGAFLFGSILSCTDTVAVLALLKEAGAPKKFNSLIEGESLFNDGTCMILFAICAQIMQGNDLSIRSIIWHLITLTIGGSILGLIGGVVASYLIKQFRTDPILTLNVSFCSCFLVFYIAENVDFGFKVSGILALVAMGLYMAAFGKTRISAQAKQTVHYFWKYIIYVAQTIIFVTAGIIVGGKILSTKAQFVDTQDFYKLGGLYLIMMGARFISIGVFMPFLSNFGYGLTWKEVVILTYGGLRGAIGIAFSLIVSHIEGISPKFKNIALFDMAGCAFLTLVINAPTAGWVIKKIGLSVKSPVREKLFLNFMENVRNELSHRLQGMKSIKYLQDAQWSKVEQYAALNDIDGLISEYKKRQDAIESKQHQIEMKNSFRESFLSDYEDIDLEVLSQFRSRFLIALKGMYWEKFENHQCTSQTVILLTEATDWDFDTINEPLNSWDYLESSLKNPVFVSLCFKMKDWPILGKISTSALFSYIGSIYDIISTYVEALEECELELQLMHADKEIISRISRESKDNRSLALEYLDQFIKVSFPEIANEIQVNKVTQSIITYGKLILNTHHEYGQIDDNEFLKLKQIFDSRITALENSDLNWEHSKITPIQHLQHCEFFKCMTPEQVKKLCADKIDILLEKAEFIIREDEKARYLYYIIRGQASQQSSKTERSYKRKLGKYDLIGSYNALVTNLRYSSSVCADSIVVVYGFPLNDIMEIVRHNQAAQGYLYRFCLPLLAKVHPDLEGLCNFSQKQLIEFSKKMVYKKIKKEGSLVMRSFADIVFSGKIKFGQTILEGPQYICYTTNPSCKTIQVKSKVRMLQLSENDAKDIMEGREHRPSFRRTFGASRNTNNYFLPSTQGQNPTNYFRAHTTNLQARLSQNSKA